MKNVMTLHLNGYSLDFLNFPEYEVRKYVVQNYSDGTIYVDLPEKDCVQFNDVMGVYEPTEEYQFVMDSAIRIDSGTAMEVALNEGDVFGLWSGVIAIHSPALETTGEVKVVAVKW